MCTLPSLNSVAVYFLKVKWIICAEYLVKCLVQKGEKDYMMDKKENTTKEEAIKSVMFTFAVLHYQGETIGKVLLSSIGYLRRQYEQTGNSHFMNLAEIELLA